MYSNITPLKRERITSLLNKITEYKVIYISANIGCGKTFEVQKLENKIKQKFIWYNIQKEDNENKYFIDNIDSKINEIDSEFQIIVIEDLYLLINEEKRKQLSKFIEATQDNIHFIICTRNILTPEYRQMAVENKLLLITNKELDFTKEDIKELFKENNIEITYEEIENIMIKITYGYAIGIIYLLSRLLKGDKFGKILLYECEQEMFEYVQCAILDKIDNIHRRFLVKISLLKEITIETATAVTGNPNSKNILKDLSNYGSFLINKKNKYVLNEFFKKVLIFEINEKFSKEEINELYNNIAFYYEQKGERIESVKNYILAQEFEKSASLLEKEIKNSIAITSHEDIENYIKKLPEDVIIRHSALCSNLCIMYLIKYKLKEANIWYEKLKQLKKELPRNSPNLREIDENILYAKIAMPATKDVDLVTDLKVLLRVIGDRNSISQKFTMTGNQPSLMSGSKDFCNWSNHYKILYMLMKPIVEKLFEESAVGIADIGIGEALYQKNKLNEAYINIIKGIGEAQQGGIADTLFVGYGLCAQIEFSKGNIEECNKIINQIKEEIKIRKAHHLTQNYKAFCARIYIQKREIDKVKKWLKEVDIDIKSKFSALDRYQYLTQIRAYILLENYKEALLTLDIMFPYIETFNRTYYKIEYYILKAITLNKLKANKNDIYANIEQALLIAQRYNFVRIFVDESYELKEILEDYKKVKNKKVKENYINAILEEVYNFYNIHYKNSKKDKLTKTELEVMKLIEKGLSNEEIAKKLSVSIATIKTHINHIYRKLEVNNRTKAVNKFKKMQ